MAICTNDGAWTEPPLLVQMGQLVQTVCPHCGHDEPFAQYPLCWISGASGTDKSTVAPLLRHHLPGYVIFEGEAIDFWRFDGAPEEYSSLYNQWLKVAYEIALNGCLVVVVTTALPPQLDACTMRCRFSAIHYLGLVCAPEMQRHRLLHRPAWRNAAGAEFIAAACGFTRQIEDYAHTQPSAMTLHDTTTGSPETSAQQIAAWVRARLPRP